MTSLVSEKQLESIIKKTQQLAENKYANRPPISRRYGGRKPDPLFWAKLLMEIKGGKRMAYRTLDENWWLLPYVFPLKPLPKLTLLWLSSKGGRSGLLRRPLASIASEINGRGAAEIEKDVAYLIQNKVLMFDRSLQLFFVIHQIEEQIINKMDGQAMDFYTAKSLKREMRVIPAVNLDEPQAGYKSVKEAFEKRYALAIEEGITAGPRRQRDVEKSVEKLKSPKKPAVYKETDNAPSTGSKGA